MLGNKLESVIFRMQSREFVFDGRPLHKVSASTRNESFLNSRERKLDQFKGSANDTLYGEGEAAAGHLVAENVNAFETEFPDDEVQKFNAVRARFAKSQANVRIHEL